MKNLYQVIKEAQAVLITAGAGMGVDSGLPDFRGNEGFWKAYPPIAKLGLSFSDMANPQWFTTNPPLAWAFYGHRLNLYRDTIPHKGFSLLLEYVKQINDNYFIFTSNVDGQFQKAGFDDNKIYEVHGSIHYFQCSENCNDDILDASDENIEVDIEKFEAINIPLCKKCKDIARPNILMFGDCNWNDKRAYSQQYRYNTWIQNNKNKNLVIIEIGAGVEIPTIRNEGEKLSKKYKNTTLIRINPRDYQLDNQLGYSLEYGGLEGLQRILGDKL